MIFEKNGIKIAHFIFTRWNYPQFKGRKDVNGTTILDQNWIDKRISIFEKYYVPSIVNQTNKNFTCILNFDPTSSEELLKKYEGLANTQIICTPHKEFLAKWLEENQIDLLITTRIDNDDLIAPFFIEKIQQKIDYSTLELNNLLLDFTGVQYDLKTKSYSKIFTHKCDSSFLSVFSTKLDGYKTCFFAEHPQMPNFFKKQIKISEEPAFVQLIHSSNLANRKIHGPLNGKELMSAKNIFEKILT